MRSARRASALVLFDGFTSELSNEGINPTFDLSDSWVIAGLFIGGLMPFLFASLAMQAVGRVGGQVVEEVRRQFREIPGIMEGTGRPEYGRTVNIVTAEAIKKMMLPAGIPIFFPIVRGSSAGAPRWLLIGTIVTGIFPAIAMTPAAAPGTTRKKLIEDGAYGGKGSEARRRGHGRHRRRTLQGHRRPRDQPVDQDHEHRRDPDHPPHRRHPRLARGANRFGGGEPAGPGGRAPRRRAPAASR
jgi:Na+/H+-translocating membrane pyrophosphatase